MKQDIRSSFWLKAAALLVTLACAVTAIFGWFYCAMYWDSMFEVRGYTNSMAWNQAMNYKYSLLMEVLDNYDSMRRGSTLGYVGDQVYQEWLDALSPTKTNFRYILRDNATGEILLSSSGEDSLQYVPAGDLTRHVQTISPSQIYYNYREYDEEKNITIFFADDNSVIGEVTGNETRLNRDGETYYYALEYGVDSRGLVQDEFYAARNSFRRGDIRILYWTVGLTLAALGGTVLLMSCAGRRRGAEDFTLNWTDKIPYDLYLFLMAWAAAMTFALGFNLLVEGYRFHYDDPSFYAMMGGAGAAFTLGFAFAEAGLMSTATRCKTNTLLRNTLILKLCKLIGRRFRALGSWWETIFGSWSVTKRVVVLFTAYVLGSIVTALALFIFFLPFQGYVLYLLCKWAKGWQAIEEGTAAIVGGKPDTTVDTSGMHPKLCKELILHARQLNDLGSAINSAVEERMKSERMKTELITNVSHDLKTPLTSIINYVDLLKKEDIQEEKAREYIEVLDRKSQRLKKLTEDLVEASKASTGAIAVTAERLGMVQLVNQALGEYSERFAAAGLTPVPTLPEEEVYVNADGRHMWRIVDNLLGNCLKYALTGTRVYLDLVRWDGCVVLSVKNVSAQQLNIPAEQLLERFVRGDESRATEGSGLGLSIARSLTELQGGTFRLEVDGDLFKAVVSLPVVK